MLNPRRRLIVAYLTGTLALTGVGLVLPSASTPAQASACREVHTAKVVRDGLRPIITGEVRAYTRKVQSNKVDVQYAKETYANIIADPGSTKNQKLVAIADLRAANSTTGVVAAALRSAKAAQKMISTCGLPAMQALTSRVTRYENALSLGIAITGRTQYQVHLKADTNTRDVYRSLHQSEWLYWAQVVEADQSLLDSLNATISKLG